MEQQLDASHLRPCFVSKAFALSVVAVAIGTSILLATYGISLFWRPMPAVAEIRISNPEVIVKQEKPFVLASAETSRKDPHSSSNRPERGWNFAHQSGVDNPVTTPQEVIQQEVIVFSSVKHGGGTIVTGWKYPNGSGRVPSNQFCYYSARNLDKSSTRVDLAMDGKTLNEAALTLVPESEQALGKCQWWRS